jgi:cell division protein FtsI/penicillin-binding protein 2
VLVQIGLRIPAEHLHQRLLDLGYSKYPEAGLGGERRGTIPALPWKPAWAHASVSFGHELFVTLWQHAAALATVVRGGEYLPLRLIDAVEQQGRRWPIASALPRRQFGAQACEQVRQMMMLGAREGTGAKVYDAQLVMGTKTGTAQKVPGEVCLHAEAEHHLHHAGCVGAQACRQQLAGQKPHNGACYTSSMCIFGRLPDSAREVLVLVVVDEPRRGKKFGADVAGPAAAAILAEALGRTHAGARPPQRSPEGFVSLEAGPAGAARAPALSDQPWREVEREAR